MGYVCELCQIFFSSPDSFYEHLKEHSREELEALRKPALLDIQDPKKHDDLVWEMIKMEYLERLKELEKKTETRSNS
jgi:hypothetical protein